MGKKQKLTQEQRKKAILEQRRKSIQEQRTAAEKFARMTSHFSHQIASLFPEYYLKPKDEFETRDLEDRVKRLESAAKEQKRLWQRHEDTAKRPGSEKPCHDWLWEEDRYSDDYLEERLEHYQDAGQPKSLLVREIIKYCEDCEKDPPSERQIYRKIKALQRR